MILTDREIVAAMDAKAIVIFPRPDSAVISSTAVDLTLDKRILVWKPNVTSPTGSSNAIRPKGTNFSVKGLMDRSEWAEWIDIDEKDGYNFSRQGQFILAYTREKVSLPHSSRIAARVEGKSSLARLGIGVHVTAPTIHAGFGAGTGEEPEKAAQPIQLEMFNLSGLPVVLDVGMAICQLILEEVREVPLKGYQGQFNKQPGVF